MEKLKILRKSLNLTQKMIAESIGIDQRQYNRYENGKNEIPLRYVKKICEIYKISADWLLDIDKDPT